jgi:hypothetical protein
MIGERGDVGDVQGTDPHGTGGRLDARRARDWQGSYRSRATRQAARAMRDRKRPQRSLIWPTGSTESYVPCRAANTL